MQIDATPPGEIQHGLGQQQAVGHHHEHIKPGCSQGCTGFVCPGLPSAKALRRVDWEPCRLRHLLDRTGLHRQTTARRTVRLCEYANQLNAQGSLLRQQCLELLGGKAGRACKAHPQHIRGERPGQRCLLGGAVPLKAWSGYATA